MAYGGDTTNSDIANRLREQEWLPCDGVFVSRDEYKDLFNVIGTAFGSNSNTTFQVPDMRGRFLRGVDQGQKRDPDVGSRQASAPNGNTGDKVGSMQEDQFKMHKHAIKAKHAGQTGGSSTGDPLAVAGWSKNPVDKEVETTGGTETRPKNIFINWIIKAKHILPRKP
jgi:microcystin-dependent protein